MPFRKGRKVLRPVGWRVFRSKWFYFLVFFVFATSYGYSRYQRYLFVADDPGVFRITDYRITGETPFYQTQADHDLTRELADRRQSHAFRYLARKYYDLYQTDYSRGRLLTQCVRVGPDQFPDIHQMVTDACEVLGVKPVPPVYVGDTKRREVVLTNFQSPELIVSSDLLRALSPDELRFLLAREVAHIRCGHVLFLDMIRSMTCVLDAAIPDFLTVAVFGSLGLELLRWLREAEISADRGGLVVTGNIDTATSALIKLNIGVSVDASYGRPDPHAFAAQLDDLGEERITSASAAMNELRNPNAFLTVRVRHLIAWYEANPEIFTETY